MNLEYKILSFLGDLAYGIYIIHPLVILFCSLWIKDLDLSDGYKYALAYGSVMTLTILLAYLTYTYYEKPFMNLKERFSVIKKAVRQPREMSV